MKKFQRIQHGANLVEREGDETWKKERDISKFITEFQEKRKSIKVEYVKSWKGNKNHPERQTPDT